MITSGCFLRRAFLCFAFILISQASHAQFDSGSDGSDGVFNPLTNTTIDMNDHPDGIYQYSSVNIPNGVTVSFIPNAANTPVYWLVQGDCTIAGSLSVSGNHTSSSNTDIQGALGGPGGYAGGNGAVTNGAMSWPGLGPGGGTVDVLSAPSIGGNASFRTLGQQANTLPYLQYPPGQLYGNDYLLPLIGGSGGAGGSIGSMKGGGGGGGAIMIASSATISITGTISANGGRGYWGNGYCVAWGGGGGSGGAIRLIATTVTGGGALQTSGGVSVYYVSSGCVSTPNNTAGSGWTRIDTLNDLYTRAVDARGYQNIIFLPANSTPSMNITSVAGLFVSPSPTGQVATPDVSVPGSQAGSIPIVVSCVNIPTGTPIVLEARTSTNGLLSGSATNTGTLASSTATIFLDLPPGTGTLMAKASVGISPSKSIGPKLSKASYLETGLAGNGERFAKMEINSTLGGGTQIVYETESGLRIPLPN